MTQTELTTEDRIYRIILDNETYGKATYIIAAEIDGLTAQLAEARALLRDAVAQTLAGNALAGELIEARAQIAALTPAAEAYRACVRWENASSYGTQEECGAAWTEYLAATRRAIAFVAGATP